MDLDTGPAEDAAPPPVSLDTLLRLPAATLTAPNPVKGGATRMEWRERFAAAQSELDAAQARLAGSQKELEELAAASDSWQVSAPGGSPGGDTGPLSYGKRLEIRRGREDVAAAERALSELRVRANLADVPRDWIELPEAAAPPPAP